MAGFCWYSLSQNKRRTGRHHSRSADMPKPVGEYLGLVEAWEHLRLVEVGDYLRQVEVVQYHHLVEAWEHLRLVDYVSGTAELIP